MKKAQSPLYMFFSKTFFKVVSFIFLYLFICSLFLYPVSTLAASAQSQCSSYFIKSELLQNITDSEMTFLLKIAESYTKASAQEYLESRTLREEIQIQLSHFLEQKNFAPSLRDHFKYLFADLVEQRRPATLEIVTQEIEQKKLHENQLQRQSISEKDASDKKLSEVEEIFWRYKASNLNEALLKVCNEDKPSQIGRVLKELHVLKDMGADLDARSSEGRKVTPLMVAAERSSKDIVQMLLAAGANKDLRNHEGLTALMIMASELYIPGDSSHLQKAETAVLLISNTNIEFKNKQGQTALMLAAWNGKLRFVEYLIQAGAKVDATDTESRTALLLASQSGQAAVVQLLLQAHANLETKSTQGWTALLLAASHGNNEVVDLLLNAGANPNVKTPEGQTALQLAHQYKKKSNDRLIYLLETAAEKNKG